MPETEDVYCHSTGCHMSRFSCSFFQSLNQFFHRWLICSHVLTASAAFVMAATPDAVGIEVDALLARLESSGCEFNRNGTWYAGGNARAHLQKKREYLANKGLLRSAEQFIELAASSSSMSGHAYQVRCGAGAAQPSAQWLTKELAAIRGRAAQSGSAQKLRRVVDLRSI